MKSIFVLAVGVIVVVVSAIVFVTPNTKESGDTSRIIPEDAVVVLYQNIPLSSLANLKESSVFQEFATLNLIEMAHPFGLAEHTVRQFKDTLGSFQQQLENPFLQRLFGRKNILAFLGSSKNGGAAGDGSRWPNTILLVGRPDFFGSIIALAAQTIGPIFPQIEQMSYKDHTYLKINHDGKVFFCGLLGHRILASEQARALQQGIDTFVTHKDSLQPSEGIENFDHFTYINLEALRKEQKKGNIAGSGLQYLPRCQSLGYGLKVEGETIVDTLRLRCEPDQLKDLKHIFSGIPGKRASSILPGDGFGGIVKSSSFSFKNSVELLRNSDTAMNTNFKLFTPIIENITGFSPMDIVGQLRGEAVLILADHSDGEGIPKIAFVQEASKVEQLEKILDDISKAYNLTFEKQKYKNGTLNVWKIELYTTFFSKNVENDADSKVKAGAELQKIEILYGSIGNRFFVANSIDLSKKIIDSYHQELPNKPSGGVIPGVSPIDSLPFLSLVFHTDSIMPVVAEILKGVFKDADLVKDKNSIMIHTVAPLLQFLQIITDRSMHFRVKGDMIVMDGVTTIRAKNREQ